MRAAKDSGLDSDLFPVDFEFFGNEHREGGMDALAHFRFFNVDTHVSVGKNFDPRTEVGGNVCRRCIETVLRIVCLRLSGVRSTRREKAADRQPSGCRGRTHDRSHEKVAAA